MLDRNIDGSIFTEMAERRSRSEELHAKAVEKGLAVEQAALSEPDASVFEAEPEMKPAFDMESIEASSVSENELQVSASEELVEEASLPESRPDPGEEEVVLEIPADPLGEDSGSGSRETSAQDTLAQSPEAVAHSQDGLENAEELVEAERPLDDPAPEALAKKQLPEESEALLEEQPAEESVPNAAVAEAQSAGEPALDSLSSPEDLIDQSEGLLGDAPEPIADAEVVLAAEELVDQIGSVVDIQKLPKTQPSRVMSKVAKAKETAEEKQSASAIAPESAKGSEKAPSPAKPDPTASSTPKKKKKISLLDSYFKGL